MHQSPSAGRYHMTTMLTRDVTERTSIVDGRYRIERVLGEGGFGRVYCAYDTRLKHNVAIKELLASRNATNHPSYSGYVDRFEREAQAAFGLHHPNVVDVHEMHLDREGNHYLVMEYVDGLSLKDLLSQVGTLPVARAVAIATDLARALVALEERGIVHRDIKPGNIMISHRGRAKLADFGIALITDDPTTREVGRGHPGTRVYMSPEQLTGGRLLDGRSDLYSLGVVLYEMLVGQRPENVGVPLQVVRPTMPPALSAIVDKLLQPEVEARYPHAAAVVDELEQFSLTAPPTATAPRRHWSPLVSVVIGVIAVGLIAYKLYVPGPIPASTPTVASTAVPTPTSGTAVAPTTSSVSVRTPAVQAPAPTPTTMTWQDANHLVTLAYPRGWMLNQSPDPNDSTLVLQVYSPDRSVLSLSIITSPRFGALDEEINDLRTKHAQESAKPQSAKYEDNAVQDVQIGGEPAKTFTYTYSGDAPSTDAQVWEVNHAGKEYLITADSIGTHRSEIEAIIASIVFT